MEMKEYKSNMKAKELEIKNYFLDSMVYNSINLYKVSKIEIVAFNFSILCIKKYKDSEGIERCFIEKVRYPEKLYESLKHIDVLEELGIEIEYQQEVEYEKTFWGGINRDCSSVTERWIIDCSKIKETPKIYQAVRKGKVLATFSRRDTVEFYISDYFLNCEEDCERDEFEVVEHEVKNSIME